MKLWLFICRAVTWFYLRCVYSAWSRVYRAVVERSYSAVHLLTFSSLRELGSYLSAKANLWKADSWKQLFDVVSRPERAQQLFEGLEDTHDGLDCDEYAIWAVNVIHLSLLFGKLPANEHVGAPVMLTVVWLDEHGKPNGHNVCLVKADMKWTYLDYGQPTGHSDAILGVVQAVVLHYAPGSTVICWALHDRTMNHLETNWG